jgi:hypothetical protein
MKSHKLRHVTALMICVASLAINVLQGRRILRLEDEISTGNSREALTEGQDLPSLAVTDKDGKTAILDFRSDSRQTMIYVLSPSCIWCERNSRSFDALSKSGLNLRILGLSASLEGMEAFVARTGFEFPVYKPTGSTAVERRLADTPTPTTILVSRSGTVIKLWSGSYVGSNRASLQEYFKIVLPSY